MQFENLLAHYYWFVKVNGEISHAVANRVKLLWQKEKRPPIGGLF